MQNCKPGSYLLLIVIVALALISAASIAAAQNNDRPWMNPSLSQEERADLVLKQLTLDEKLALLHGNGMAHALQWQMPLSTCAISVTSIVVPFLSPETFSSWNRLFLYQFTRRRQGSPCEQATVVLQSSSRRAPKHAAYRIGRRIDRLSLCRPVRRRKSRIHRKPLQVSSSRLRARSLCVHFRVSVGWD